MADQRNATRPDTTTTRVRRVLVAMCAVVVLVALVSVPTQATTEQERCEFTLSVASIEYQGDDIGSRHFNFLLRGVSADGGGGSDTYMPDDAMAWGDVVFPEGELALSAIAPGPTLELTLVVGVEDEKHARFRYGTIVDLTLTCGDAATVTLTASAPNGASKRDGGWMFGSFVMEVVATSSAA